MKTGDNILWAMALICPISKIPGAVAFAPSTFYRSVAALSTFRPSTSRSMASVTGSVYSTDDDIAPKVELFTKEGCTLCDKVKDVLSDLRDDIPHSLEQIDITDEGHQRWFSKYKYDIPVLHLDGKFWVKHKITIEEAKQGLQRAREGIFDEQSGDPDAGAMERRQAERQQQEN